MDGRRVMATEIEHSSIEQRENSDVMFSEFTLRIVRMEIIRRSNDYGRNRLRGQEHQDGNHGR